MVGRRYALKSRVLCAKCVFYFAGISSLRLISSNRIYQPRDFFIFDPWVFLTLKCHVSSYSPFFLFSSEHTSLSGYCHFQKINLIYSEIVSFHSREEISPKEAVFPAKCYFLLFINDHWHLANLFKPSVNCPK